MLKRVNSFTDLAQTCIQEVLEKDGMKFLRDMISQLYLALKSPDRQDSDLENSDDDESGMTSEDYDDTDNGMGSSAMGGGRRKSLMGTALFEK